MAPYHKLIVIIGSVIPENLVLLTKSEQFGPKSAHIRPTKWKNWSSTSLKIPLMCQGVRDNSWLQKVSWACLILSYAENESVIT